MKNLISVLFLIFASLAWAQDPNFSNDPFHLEQTGKLVTVKVFGGKNKKTEFHLIGKKAAELDLKTLKLRAYSLKNPGKELSLKQNENIFTSEESLVGEKIKLEVEEPKNKQKDSFEFQMH